MKKNQDSFKSSFKSSQGINFCGYKINEYRLKIRNRRKKKIKEENKITKI